MLSTKQTILARLPELQRLAKDSAVEGALDFLPYLLSAPYFLVDVPHPSLKAFRFLPNALFTRRTKLPRLLLRMNETGCDAAALLFEYGLHGVPIRCFIPADSDGYRTVIAAPELREEAALQVGNFLLRRGALLSMVSYLEPDGGERLGDAPTTLPRRHTELLPNTRLLAQQTRLIGRRLPLQSTFDRTLAAISRNTRHNLRRSMQQARHDLGLTFLPQANIALRELQELAQESAYGPPDWAVEERFRAATTVRGGVLAGLRDAQGRWMSMVGGHREREMLCLDWQLNRSVGHSISLATAMRGFLIESEVQLGTRWLRFEGGTTHPLQRAFLRERCHDLLFAQRILPTAVVKRLAGTMAEGGPLATALTSSELVWSR